MTLEEGHMKKRTRGFVVSGAFIVGLGARGTLAGTLPIITRCPPDAVLVGQTCVDKYEASVWEVPAANLSGKSNAGLINKIKKGKATLTDLIVGNATEISPSVTCLPAFPGTFPANGQWTAPLYAVSIAGVHPTACVTWFQADQACALSGKRLVTNAEWQWAVAGTPDPGPDNGTTDCNTSLTAVDAVNTGSRSNCRSNWGAFDMVGNVDEWVSDWVPSPTACPGWGSFSGDDMCLAGAVTTDITPSVPIRGGAFGEGTPAGPLSVIAFEASESEDDVGFRCAR
jgi:formylglycine-generating enzyme required for sulfatase activity